MDLYQQYIHISRYSRWRDDLGRRETWEETVQRYIDFFDKKTNGEHTKVLNGKVKSFITDLKVMPSMRALMSAGPALERDYLELLSSMLSGVSENYDDARIQDIFDFGGDETKELLRRMSKADSPLNDLFESIDTKIGKKDDV